MNEQDSKFNERLLKEIGNLRDLREKGIDSSRITNYLEILRFIRNTELKQSFDEGKRQEDEWMEVNKHITYGVPKELQKEENK